MEEGLTRPLADHLTCAVLVLRRVDDHYLFMPCGAKTRYSLSVDGDHLFRVCQRHPSRLTKLETR